MNRFLTLIAVLAGLFMSGSQFLGAKDTDTAVKPKATKYQKTFAKDKVSSAEGPFISLRKVGEKLYIEMPRKNLGREMLIAATVTTTSNPDVATLGYKARKPLHCRFVERDSSIFLEKVTILPDFDENDPSGKNVRLVSRDAVVWGGQLFCESDNRENVVFEATSLFKSLDEISPLGLRTSIGLSLKSKLQKDHCSIDELKAFDDNVSVKSTLTYSVTSSFLGLLTVLKDAPVSVGVTHTVLLLPEQKMRPRLADTRIGIFLTDRYSFSSVNDRAVKYSVINRWRLEPKDTAAFLAGELTEPVEPITFYIDNAFPEDWRGAVHAGVLRWNAAFEAIGFKNAIQTLDFPENDSEFDPDNLKYSCIRYVPSTVANAQGPSWVDPTNGEIINASVILYSNVTKLINNWRFCQTAQVDERVRSVEMPDDVMQESLEYVVAHEVGHCLGFMHNMSASAAYPVDSLRSRSFTGRYGTTASIMDYARFNYVAQPGDDVCLTPPDLGPYDYHLVRYAYSPIPEAGSMEEERHVLESWIEEKNSPMYRYGRQQVSWKCDPTAIEEDLGDDAVAASDYGVKNLKYILSNLDSWITEEDDPDRQCCQELYSAIQKQYERYMQAVMLNVGGIMLYDDPRKPMFESVDADRQKQAVRWILNELSQCGWIDNEVSSFHQPLQVQPSTDMVSDIYSDLLDKVKAVVLSSHVAEGDAYTPEMFLDDLYADVWNPTRQKKALLPVQRMKQKMFVRKCIASFAPKSSSSSSSKTSISFIEAYRPTLNQYLTYAEPYDTGSWANDEMIEELASEYGSDVVAEEMFGKAGYNWQRRIGISAIDETAALWHGMAEKCEKVLSTALRSADAADKAHYQYLLFQLRNVL